MQACWGMADLLPAACPALQDVASLLSKLCICHCASPVVTQCLRCNADLTDKAAGHKPFFYNNECGEQGTAFTKHCPKCKSVCDINDWSNGSGWSVGLVPIPDAC